MVYIQCPNLHFFGGWGFPKYFLLATYPFKGCILEEGIGYSGNDIDIGGKGGWGGKKVENKAACARLSWVTENALFWTYNYPEQLCYVKTSKSGRRADADSVSGNSQCGKKNAKPKAKGTSGLLETEAPSTWQQGLRMQDLTEWENVMNCGTDFVRGALVQTDQDIDTDAQDIDTNAFRKDFVGINNMKIACTPYGK